MTRLRIPLAVFVFIVVFFSFRNSTQAGFADPGQTTFEKRCTGCHSLDKNKEGPRLRGIYGRHSASVSDFGYSAALKKANLLWNDDSLNKWLKDPESLAPDNDMAFHVSDPKEREDIIAYLKSQSPK